MPYYVLDPETRKIRLPFLRVRLHCGSEWSVDDWHDSDNKKHTHEYLGPTRRTNSYNNKDADYSDTPLGSETELSGGSKARPHAVVMLPCVYVGE